MPFPQTVCAGIPAKGWQRRDVPFPKIVYAGLPAKGWQRRDVPFPKIVYAGLPAKGWQRSERRNARVKKGVAEASVTFCGEEARRSSERRFPQKAPQVKRSPRRRAERGATEQRTAVPQNPP